MNKLKTMREPDNYISTDQHLPKDNIRFMMNICSKEKMEKICSMPKGAKQKHQEPIYNGHSGVAS
jgi:hypothetical protein